MGFDTNNAIANYVKASKVDKKDILRFYKAQHYPAAFIGHDQAYLLKTNNNIIASAIVSAGKALSDYWLLHALVTDKTCRGKGYASKLLQIILTEKTQENTIRYNKLICFAEDNLASFYLANQFKTFNADTDIATLPKEFQQRLKSYQKKQPTLSCFCSFN